MDLWVISYNSPKKPWMLGLCHCARFFQRWKSCILQSQCMQPSTGWARSSVMISRSRNTWLTAFHLCIPLTLVLTSPLRYVIDHHHNSQIFESAVSGLRLTLDKVVKECHFFSVTPPCSLFPQCGFLKLWLDRSWSSLVRVRALFSETQTLTIGFSPADWWTQTQNLLNWVQ